MRRPPEPLPTVRARPSAHATGVVRYLRADDEFAASPFPPWVEVAMRIALGIAIGCAIAEGFYQLALAAVRAAGTNAWCV